MKNNWIYVLLEIVKSCDAEGCGLVCAASRESVTRVQVHAEIEGELFAQVQLETEIDRYPVPATGFAFAVVGVGIAGARVVVRFLAHDDF